MNLTCVTLARSNGQHKCITCGFIFPCKYGGKCSSRNFDCDFCLEDYKKMGLVENLI